MFFYVLLHLLPSLLLPSQSSTQHLLPAGRTEVDQLDNALLGNEQVLEFEVSVGPALGVEGGQGRGSLVHDGQEQGVAQWFLLGLEEVGQRRVALLQEEQALVLVLQSLHVHTPDDVLVLVQVFVLAHPLLLLERPSVLDTRQVHHFYHVVFAGRRVDVPVGSPVDHLLAQHLFGGPVLVPQL